VCVGGGADTGRSVLLSLVLNSISGISTFQDWTPTVLLSHRNSVGKAAKVHHRERTRGQD